MPDAAVQRNDEEPLEIGLVSVAGEGVDDPWMSVCAGFDVCPKDLECISHGFSLDAGLRSQGARGLPND